MTAIAYIGAALAEIAGCFAFWAWLRFDKSAWSLIPGIASLCLFAYLLTLIDAEHASRTYAAYGGVYIVSALFWLWFAEGVKPDRWDMIGAAIALTGAANPLGTESALKSASHALRTFANRAANGGSWAEKKSGGSFSWQWRLRAWCPWEQELQGSPPGQA